MTQVVIVMGSATDRPTAQKAEKILEKFTTEIKNFVQVCPKEMVEKLKNPLSLESKFRKVI